MFSKLFRYEFKRMVFKVLIISILQIFVGLVAGMATVMYTKAFGQHYGGGGIVMRSYRAAEWVLGVLMLVVFGRRFYLAFIGREYDGSLAQRSPAHLRAIKLSSFICIIIALSCFSVANVIFESFLYEGLEESFKNNAKTYFTNGIMTTIIYYFASLFFVELLLRAVLVSHRNELDGKHAFLKVLKYEVLLLVVVYVVYYALAIVVYLLMFLVQNKDIILFSIGAIPVLMTAFFVVGWLVCRGANKRYIKRLVKYET